MAVTAYNMQSSENGSDSIERTEFSIFDLSGDVSPHLPYGRAISCSVGKGNWLAVGFDHIEETMVSDQFNTSISLTDDRAMGRDPVPFVNVTALRAYLLELLAE